MVVDKMSRLADRPDVWVVPVFARLEEYASSCLFGSVGVVKSDERHSTIA